VHRIGFRYQRTIGRPADVVGTGFLTGATVRLRFRPAPAHAGVVFVRADLKGAPEVAASVHNVTGTNRRTTLGTPPAQVELVEHVLAALAGMRIDNCRVEVNAPEPPGLDGSAARFVAALAEAGVVLQSARREVWAPTRPVTVRDGAASLTLAPGGPGLRGLRVSYLLDFGPRSPIPSQRHTEVISPEGFCNGVMACRTFLLEEEAEALRRQGLGARTTWADLLVFGPRGPIRNRLRYANEPARHKVLDVVGDLALFGRDLCGHVVGCRSGHALNVALVRRLTEELAAGRPARALRAA
jgi:UDP-3-O-acyl N-acetylglucosamine deacetylase